MNEWYMKTLLIIQRFQSRLVEKLRDSFVFLLLSYLLFIFVLNIQQREEYFFYMFSKKNEQKRKKNVKTYLYLSFRHWMNKKIVAHLMYVNDSDKIDFFFKC